MTKIDNTHAALVATFDFRGITLRTILIDGEPWFVAKDALTAMGYAKSNHTTTLGKVSENRKGLSFVETPGGRQKMSVVSEAGLYELVMGSTKPEARAFQDWVTGTVLPAIPEAC